MERRPPVYVSLLSGGLAGTAVDVTLFPLDAIKTRVQSPKGFWKSGGFKNIYAGIGPAALGSAPNAALFFVTYDLIKKSLQFVDDRYRPLVHMVAASGGEVTSCLTRVPIEIVKQRRQASAGTITAQAILKETLKTEGLAGMYRGYLTTVFREIPFAIIQFPLWELLKRTWGERQGEEVSPLQASLCGACAGGVSAGMTTPLDVAKTRIMLAEKGSHLMRHPTTRAALKVIYCENGFRGLYKGLLPRFCFFFIGGIMFFGTYEHVKAVLLQRSRLKPQCDT